MAQANASASMHQLKDNEQRFKQLTKRPALAWPTLLLLITCITLFVVSTSGYLFGYWGIGWAILVNAIASYMAFTVGHDASHNALSANKKLNDWCGRISTMLLSPIPFFRMFRYIHMQHHRFANEEDKDPDLYCGRGSKWTLLLRWATLDIHYFMIYLRPSVFMKRPLSERRELGIAALFAIAVISFMISTGLLVLVAGGAVAYAASQSSKA